MNGLRWSAYLLLVSLAVVIILIPPLAMRLGGTPFDAMAAVRTTSDETPPDQETATPRDSSEPGGRDPIIVPKGPGVTITDHTMTADRTEQCERPMAKVDFAPTDDRAYQWTLASGIQAGDGVAWEWIQPDGSLHRESQLTFEEGGNRCFFAPLPIAGQQPASLPGSWQVHVVYNGTRILTENFTIGGGEGQTGFFVDDDSFERNVGPNDVTSTYYCVNRLTPPSYPATLSEVALYFLSGTGGPQVGEALTVLVGTNPDGNLNLDAMTFQTTSTSVQTLDGFNPYDVPDVTIDSGDFVVGFRMAGVLFPCAQDTDSPSQRRSYRSFDGVDFEIIDDVNADLAGNWGIRAIVTGGSGGPGPGGLGRIAATRSFLSFGSDPPRSTNIANRPGSGFTELFALTSPRIITLGDDGTGNPDPSHPIVVAATITPKIPSCCTLIVVEDAGGPGAFRWELTTGTLYSTGSEGSAFPAGAPITDLSQYDRNSVIWEAPDLPFLILDSVTPGMGGGTSVTVCKTGRPDQSCPAQSVQTVLLDWGQADSGVTLQITSISASRRLNHCPAGTDLELTFFPSITGDFESIVDTKFRVVCDHPAGAADFAEDQDGPELYCCYTEPSPPPSQVQPSTLVTVVAGSFGNNSGGLNPFKQLPPEPSAALVSYEVLGCAIGDTESIALEEFENPAIRLFDNGSAKDDAFQLSVDGVVQGITPPGGATLFEIDDLSPGTHELCILVTLAPDNIGTYEVVFFGGLERVGGGTIVSRSPAQGTQDCFEFTVP